MSLPIHLHPFLSPGTKGLLLLLICFFISGIATADTGTSLTISTTPPEVQIGDTYTVSGGLQSESGTLIPNESVYLEISTDGMYGEQLDRHNSFFAATNATGYYLFKQPILKTGGYCRVRFLGTKNLKGSVSQVLKIGQSGDAQNKSKGIGTMFVKSSPDQAQIYIDDVFVGNTTSYVSGIAEGPHELTLSKDGYQNETMEVYINPGAVASVSSTLSLPGMNTESPFSDTWSEAYTPMNASDSLIDIDNGVVTVSLGANTTDSTGGKTVPHVVTSYSKFDGQSQYSIMITTPNQNSTA